MWSKFYELNDTYGLGIELREGAFEAKFPNGSTVGFEGAHDMARVQRLRGDTISGVLVIDEAAFFSDRLIGELLGPVATAMFMTTSQNISLASSPGLQKRGKFYDLCSALAWEHHKLTGYDNPAIVDVPLALEQLREANAWSLTHPQYIREGLGEWCDDSTHNVYDLTDLNLIDGFPEGPWTTVMAIDYGKNDQSAWSVAGWRDHDPALYILHVEGESDLDIEDVAQKIKPLIERYAPVGIYADHGGGGAQHSDYLRRRHQIPVKPVAKRQNYKAPAIQMLNADMRRGHIRVLRDSPLVDQMQTLQWDPAHVGEQEHPGMPNDLADVCLYSTMHARHYRAEPAPAPRPNYGTAEHWQHYTDEGLANAQLAAAQYATDVDENAEALTALFGHE